MPLQLFQLAPRTPNLFDRPVGGIDKIEVGGKTGRNQADWSTGHLIWPIKTKGLCRRQRRGFDRVDGTDAELVDRTTHSHLQQ